MTASDAAEPAQSPPPSAQGDGVLAGERVTFTGTLASLTHRQAGELVEQHGGTATLHVNQQTTLLVVGEEGWPLEEDGRPSVKLEDAHRLQQRGQNLRVLSEAEFLKALGLEDRGLESRELHTPAMLAQMLGLSVHEVRRWERAGLIKPARKLYRLSYFDVGEVARVRKLSELVAKGIPPAEIAASLARLRSVFPDVDRSLAQLEVLGSGEALVYRDERGLIESASGQRVFDFDESVPAEPEADTVPFLQHEALQRQRVGWTADDWLHEAANLTEAGELGEAEEALRMALVDRPTDPALHFHLAELLYRQNQLGGAIERYYVAVELDHQFLEAWTQLGCLLMESRRPGAAEEAFRVALDVHSDYPEAHFHLAELLEASGRTEEAAGHWRRYLEFDQRGPWAERARQRLAAGPTAEHV